MLRSAVDTVCREEGASTIAVAFYDFETETGWSHLADRWFHAASTIKLAVLVALHDAAASGRLSLDARLHVRNRFVSRADGESYRIDPARDADGAVHAQIGRSMRLRELARHMIVRSSNLATNLLLDLVGPREAQETLERLGIPGIRLLRGVEDRRAWEAGINNEVTAHGLLELLRTIYRGEGLAQDSAGEMLDVLFAQELDCGIRAGLPASLRGQAQVASKTGDISDHTHDAGLVYLPDRKPYALVVLTAWAQAATTSRQGTVARVSRLVYDAFVAGAGA